MKKILLIKLSSPSFEKEFSSFEECNEYMINNCICYSCKNDLLNGGYFIEDEEDFIIVKNAFDTDCGTEYETKETE